MNPPAHAVLNSRNSISIGNEIVRSRPLVPLCAALIAGIAFDRGLELPTWIGAVAAGFSLLVWVSLTFRSRDARIPLVLAVFFLGVAWHGGRTREFAANDIGAMAGDVPSLCRLRATVETEPTTNLKSTPLTLSWQQDPSSSMFVRATSIESADGWQDVSGRAVFYVNGIFDGVRVGDQVEVFGWLDQPSEPLNPGEFNVREYLAGKRVRAILRCERADAVRKTTDGSAYSIVAWRDSLRHRLSDLFHQTMGEREAALADAVLLGMKKSLTRDEMLPYLESGTVHLLVVSGSHLAILAGLLWIAAGVINVSLRRRAGMILCVLVFYAFLTGGDPPVVRSVVMAGIFFGQFLLLRRAEPLNSIAAAAILVFAYDPTEVTRGGTQLSFLAVMTLAILVPPFLWLDDPERFESGTASLALRAARFVRRWVHNAIATSAVVWLVSAPLIAHQFNLVSPVGVLLSPVLVIPIALALALGVALPPFMLLGSGPAGWIAMAIAKLLSCVAALMEMFESNSTGFNYVPSLPGWWVIGFYLALFGPCLFRHQATTRRTDKVDVLDPGAARIAKRPPSWFNRTQVLALVAWVAVGISGIAAEARSSPRAGVVEMHQIAVGHGGCALLRYPSGQNILIDCGSIVGPIATERSVAPFLWAKRVRAIDAVFISHADVDHFNGIEALARRFQIGAIIATPQFADFTQPAVETLYRTLAKNSIPFQFAWEGDRVRLDGGELEILLPPATSRGDDNAQSMVIECRWKGRRILFTGDLEGAGKARLLSLPSPGYHLIQAPHHGSRNSNDAALADWARPRIVISSQGNRRYAADPLDVYGPAGSAIFRTNEDGAVRCLVSESGIDVEPYRSGRKVRLP